MFNYARDIDCCNADDAVAATLDITRLASSQL